MQTLQCSCEKALFSDFARYDSGAVTFQKLGVSVFPSCPYFLYTLFARILM